MAYLLQKCGIESAEVVGNVIKESGERDGTHAWNIIKVDGDYYYLDTTRDDSSNTIQAVKNTGFGFDYFCITTEELTRTRDTEYVPTDLPICEATKGNYYYHNSAVIAEYDLNQLKVIARAAVEAKCKSFTFKCKNKPLYDKVLAEICVSGQDSYDILKAAAKLDRKIITDSYFYSYDKNLFTITVKFKYK
ncbi:MAG: hypothetical protein IJ946_01730 [Clostridia bacterium]|nr:hypothetical protein [Clostridia bacterium]